MNDRIVDNRQIFVAEDNNSSNERILELAGITNEFISEDDTPLGNHMSPMKFKVSGMFSVEPNGKIKLNIAATSDDDFPEEVYKAKNFEIFNPDGRNAIMVITFKK